MRKRVVFLTLILSICLIFATGCSDDVRHLTIRFDSNDGTEITELQVKSGEKLSRPENPVKEHYVFGGWYNGDAEWVFETDTVEKDMTLTAKWTPEVYSVTFKNYDGTELAKENVSYGSLPQYSATPEKPGNAQYSYAFARWVDENGQTVDLANIDKNIILTAEFAETLNKYKVTFKNGDEVLKEAQVEYGTTPTAPETNPTKAADAQYTYTFKGWDKNITAVTGEVVYNAEFTGTLNTYKVTFKNGDEVLKEEQVEYGTVPTAPETNPTKAADAQYTYTFKGWDKEITAVTGEVVYNAEFTETLNTYKVTFKNGEEVLKEEQVEYGTVPTAPETNPTKDVDAENHYVFDGWDNELAEVTGEIVYNALFRAEAHVYTVDSSDDTFDYIVCSCGYRNETYSYDKTVTSARKELVVSASGLALVIEGATYASVEKMTINGVEISDEITSFAIPDEVKADKERHGLQNVIVTVKDEQGYSHDLKVPVILVTEEIKDMNGLNAALKGEGDEYAIYGYYKLVADLGAANYDGINNGSSSTNWQNANGEYGFRGTFDGNGKSVSAIIYNNGIFGIVGKGAYIKNLTVNSYNYSNGRTILARTITEATIENVTINVISGSSNSYYAEGGVITALLSHSSKYINVKIKSSSDLDMLFGFSYWSYNPAKHNTFENCTVEARSIGGIICITTKEKMPEPIVPIAGVEGLNVTLNKDAVAADNMTVGETNTIELPDLAEITSITLENEEFTAYSFESGVLTINADAFAANQIGVKNFAVTGKNTQGLTVIFEITMTVELVATPVALDGTREIVLSEASEYAVDLGDYSETTVLSATFAGENATFTGGKLTLTDDYKADARKHGNQALVVTVEKDGSYYSVTVNVLVITKVLVTYDDIKDAVTLDENNVKYGYYRLSADLGETAWVDYGNTAKWNNDKGDFGFRGTFDGGNKTIATVFYSTGLFGTIGKGAVIKNITFNQNYESKRVILGYSMVGARLENVTINVKGKGATALPAVNSTGGLLTAIYCHSSEFVNVTINSQNTDIDTIFGTSAYYTYPTGVTANTFENCAVTAKSLVGLAGIDRNDNTKVSPYTDVDGLTVTLPA